MLPGQVHEAIESNLGDSEYEFAFCLAIILVSSNIRAYPKRVLGYALILKL